MRFPREHSTTSLPQRRALPPKSRTPAPIPDRLRATNLGDLPIREMELLAEHPWLHHRGAHLEETSQERSRGNDEGDGAYCVNGAASELIPFATEDENHSNRDERNHRNCPRNRTAERLLELCQRCFPRQRSAPLGSERSSTENNRSQQQERKMRTKIPPIHLCSDFHLPLPFPQIYNCRPVPPQTANQCISRKNPAARRGHAYTYSSHCGSSLRFLRNGLANTPTDTISAPVVVKQIPTKPRFRP